MKSTLYGRLSEGLRSPLISTRARAIFIALFIAIHLHPGPTCVRACVRACVRCLSLGSLSQVKRDRAIGRASLLTRLTSKFSRINLPGEEEEKEEEEAVEQEENDSFLERHEDSSALQAKGMQDDSRGGNFDSGVRFSESRRL